MKIKNIVFFLLFCSLSCSCSRNYPSKYAEVFNNIGEQLSIPHRFAFDTRYYRLNNVVLDCEKTELSSKHFDVYNVIYELSVDIRSEKEIEQVLDSIRNCQLEDLGILENTIEDLKDSIATEKESCNYNRFLALRKDLKGKGFTTINKSHRDNYGNRYEEDNFDEVAKNFLKTNWSGYREDCYETDFEEFRRILHYVDSERKARFEDIDGTSFLIVEYWYEYSIKDYQIDSASLSYEVGDRWDSYDRYSFKNQWGDKLFDLVETLDERLKEKKDLEDKVKVPYETIIDSYKQKMETIKIAGIDKLYIPAIVSINKKTKDADYRYPKGGPSYTHIEAQEWLESQ